MGVSKNQGPKYRLKNSEILLNGHQGNGSPIYGNNPIESHESAAHSLADESWRRTALRVGPCTGSSAATQLYVLGFRGLYTDFVERVCVLF